MLKTPARSIAGLCLTLMVAGPASIVSAQSNSDLRKENQRLRTRVRDFERELDAAQGRIGELEERQSLLVQEGIQPRPIDDRQPPTLS